MVRGKSTVHGSKARHFEAAYTSHLYRNKLARSVVTLHNFRGEPWRHRVLMSLRPEAAQCLPAAEKAIEPNNVQSRTTQ